jgi:ribosomal protein S18 acetylase RimI-like enzyme
LTLTPLQRLLRARPTDPFVRWRVDEREIGAVLVDGDHVAWISPGRHGQETWATALGDDSARLVGLLQQLDEVAPLDGVTVPADVFAALPARLTSPDPGHWSFWVLDVEAPIDRTSEAVMLDLDDPRIAPLLAHSDSAYLFPGHASIVRWAGVERAGRLVAVAAQVNEAKGAAHIVSVCTHPDFRGRRLAGHACNAIIRASLAEGAPLVFLEMYADNEAGRRAYASLGMTEVGRYRSGLLRPPA